MAGITLTISVWDSQTSFAWLTLFTFMQRAIRTMAGSCRHEDLVYIICSRIHLLPQRDGVHYGVINAHLFPPRSMYLVPWCMLHAPHFHVAHTMFPCRTHRVFMLRTPHSGYYDCVITFYSNYILHTHICVLAFACKE